MAEESSFSLASDTGNLLMMYFSIASASHCNFQMADGRWQMADDISQFIHIGRTVKLHLRSLNQ